jgi:hypothetical protein
MAVWFLPTLAQSPQQYYNGRWWDPSMPYPNFTGNAANAGASSGAASWHYGENYGISGWDGDATAECEATEPKIACTRAEWDYPICNPTTLKSSTTNVWVVFDYDADPGADWASVGWHEFGHVYGMKENAISSGAFDLLYSVDCSY